MIWKSPKTNSRVTSSEKSGPLPRCQPTRVRPNRKMFLRGASDRASSFQRKFCTDFQIDPQPLLNVSFWTDNSCCYWRDFDQFYQFSFCSLGPLENCDFLRWPKRIFATTKLRIGTKLTFQHEQAFPQGTCISTLDRRR